MSSSSPPTPFQFHCTVLPEWLDYNDHMNLAFYIRAFDMAFDEFMDWIGMDEAGRARHQGTVFAAEAHVTYKSEVRAGAPLRITVRLLDFDEKRLRTYCEMYHAEEGFLASTVEFLSLYVDSQARRVSNFPEEVRQRLERLAEAHARLPHPEVAGQGIAMKPKRPAQKPAPKQGGE